MAGNKLGVCFTSTLCEVPGSSEYTGLGGGEVPELTD